jgi:hypothetical protein
MTKTITRWVVVRNGWDVRVSPVEISAYCPVCGGPRGEPKWHHFCEDGEWLTCQTWDNPCGHVDLYKDVLKEADQLQEAKL